MWWMMVIAIASTPEQAADALQAGDFKSAAKAYRALVARTPDDGQLWYALGASEFGLQRLEQAADAWVRARALGARPALSAYNEACAHARLGKSDEALAALAVALGSGRFTADQVRNDSDLASLAGDPRLEALFAELDAKAHPCEHDPRYDAFDFWVGSWVVTSSGQPAGTNVITREQHGCVLVERWTDSTGGTGTSLTFLDPGISRWRQLWIDASGRAADYEGDFNASGQLVMEARTADASGALGRSRGTWTRNPDGTVRQVFESPGADGLWQVTFDGLYTRAAP